VLNALASFDDYRTAADWARQSLAFCVEEGIIDSTAMELHPLEAITRAQVAEMLFALLGLADLL
jgi:hypothetical protein